MPDLAVATEGCAEIAYEETVDPDCSGVDPCADPFGTIRIASDQGRGKSEPGVVGHLDRLLLAREGLDRQDRTEDLLGQDLAAWLGVDQDRRPIVEMSQLVIRRAAQDRLGAGCERAAYEAVNPFEVLPG